MLNYKVEKKLFCLLTFLFSNIFLFSQVVKKDSAQGAKNKIELTTIALYGKVIDAKSKEPLAGSSLFLSDLRVGVIADINGNYFFNNIPVGHHLVEISHIGYTSEVEHIDIEKNTEKIFSLQPSAVENQAVVITGVSNATSIRKTPIAITSIRRMELMQTTSSNIIDALSKEPGISQSTTGPGISKPIIRGLGYNRVVVIGDGVRQEGQQWGDEHGIEIDELSVNRVEILKGPASLMYGSDAIAGVIHLISNTPTTPGTIKGNLLTNFQSNNNLFSLHSNVSGNRKNISWNFYQSMKSAKDYKNKFDGRVLNSRLNEKNFGGFVGVNKSWGFSHIFFSAFNQKVGLVEGNRDDATGKFLLFGNSVFERIATSSDLNSRILLAPFQQIRHYKVVNENNFYIKNVRLKTNIAFQNNIRKEFGNPEMQSAAGLIFDLKTMNYNLQLVLPEKREWHTTFGLNGMYQNNQNKGEEAIIPDYNLVDAGSFVYTQRFFKNATLSTGLRLDHRIMNTKELVENNVVRFPRNNISFSNLSASAGISFEPADFFTLKINIARGFRAPNLAELASNGAHEGTNRYEYGNRDLKSETSKQFDFGVQVDYDHLNFKINLFYNRINDFIFYNKLRSVSSGDSTLLVDGERLLTFRYNQQDAKLSGLEMNLDIHPHPLDWLHFENSVSFVDGRFDKKIDGTFNLPMIPATRWISDLRANFRKTGKALRNLYFKIEMDKSFDQHKPFFAYNTETSTSAYTIVNSGIGADIISKKEKIICSIHLAGMNVTNTAYQNHLSRLKYTDENLLTGRTGVYNMGRNFSLKINFPLQFL